MSRFSTVARWRPDPAPTAPATLVAGADVVVWDSDLAGFGLTLQAGNRVISIWDYGDYGDGITVTLDYGDAAFN